MEEKQVTLVRKQTTPFTVNYPVDGRLKNYIWNGTKGNLLNKKTVPFEVYEWLAQYTTTFHDGSLIIENADDEQIQEIKENIEDVEKIEQSVLTQKEIEEILTTGNHLTLKKKLNELVDGLSDELAKNQKRYVVTVAREIGIDSSAKRKVLAEWADINPENSDLIFDKELREMYDNE
jgi:hypothetical protein